MSDGNGLGRRALIRRGLQLAALPGMTALLAACGGTAAPAATGTAAPAATRSVGAAAGAQTLTVANYSEISGLDPHIRNPVATALVTAQIFEMLFQLDAQGNLQPMLATDYKNIDPTTWQIGLRQGVTFHDGEPWNAQAFVANIQRMFSSSVPSNASSVIPAVIPGQIDVVDDHTVRLHTKVPDAVLPHRFAAYFVAFNSPKSFQNQTEAYIMAHPAGTGPFRFVEWKKDDHLTLAANPSYWGGAPKLSQLTFRPLSDPQTRVSALLSGGVDLALVIPTESMAQIKSNPSTSILTSPNGITAYLLYLDARHGGPLANPNVRLALNYAIDRDSIIKQILAGQATPIQSIVTPQSFGFDSDLKPYGYQPDKAKQLLQQAGFGSGFTVPLWFAPGSSPNDSECVQAMQAQLAKVGVQVNIQTADNASLVTQILQGKITGMFYAGKTNLILDADYIFNDSSASAPFGQYDPLVGQEVTLWKQEQQAFDPTARAALAKQVQQLLYDAPNWVYLYQMNDIYGVSKAVKGWQPATDELLTFTGTTVVKA